MSWQAQAWVWSLQGLTPMQKFVALAFAGYADPDGGSIRPSIARVAAETGACEKTVRECKNALVAAGLMHLIREGNGRANPSEYAMPVDLAALGEHQSRMREAGKVNPVTGSQNPVTGSQEPRSSYRQPLREPYKEPNTPIIPIFDDETASDPTPAQPALIDLPAVPPKPAPKAAPKRRAGPTEDELQQAVAIWNEVCGPKLPRVRKLTDAWRAHLAKRLADDLNGSLDEWRAVCRTVVKSPLLTGTADTDRNWRASFDWVIKPNNLAKILNGNYPAAPVQQSYVRGAL